MNDELNQQKDPSGFPDTKPANRDDAKSLQIGPYKLIQKIGEGGMGEVWMAEQTEPIRRRVALKMIKQGLDSRQILARFEAERQALALMDHPNIAKVLDAGATESGSPYFAMELVQGIEITEYCDRQRMTPVERLELFATVCEAVQHAHQKAIIHRDLKPANVLVQMCDGKPIAKVIDFGVAKALQKPSPLTDKTLVTDFGQPIGTVQYMSPEQATLDVADIDTKTDIYSLGVMLYELLTGSTPIEKETLRQNANLKRLELVRDYEPPRPSQRLSSSTEKIKTISEMRKVEPGKLHADLRGELDWIVMKAIEKDRKRRYRTASDFADDIGRFLHGDPVEARPPSVAYRARKFASKNKNVLLTIATILVLLLTSTVVSTSLFFWALDEAATAKQKSIQLEVKTKIAQSKELEASNANEENERALARSKYFLAISRWDSNRVLEAKRLLSEIPVQYRHVEWHLAKHRFEGECKTCFCGFSIYDACLSTTGENIYFSNSLGIYSRNLAVPEKPKRIIDNGVRVAISPDGLHLAIERVIPRKKKLARYEIAIYDTNSMQEICVFSHSNQIRNFEWHSPQLLVTCTQFEVAAWNTKNLQKAGSAKLSYGRRIRCSPICNHVIVWCVGELKKYTIDSDGKLVHKLNLSLRELKRSLGITSYLADFDVSPNGQELALAYRGKTIVVDTDDFSIANTFSSELPRSGVRATRIYYVPDGTSIVKVYGAIARVFGRAIGDLKATLKGHDSSIVSLAFSCDGSNVLTASSSGSIKSWDLTKLDRDITPVGETPVVVAVSIQNKKKRLLAVNSKLEFLDTKLPEEGEAVGSAGFKPIPNKVQQVSKNSWLDTSRLDVRNGCIAIAAVNMIQVFSLENQKTVFEFDCDDNSSFKQVTCCALNFSATRLAVGNEQGKIRIWNLKEKTFSEFGGPGPLTSVRFGKDNNDLVASDRSGKAYLFKLEASQSNILHFVKDIDWDQSNVVHFGFLGAHAELGPSSKFVATKTGYWGTSGLFGSKVAVLEGHDGKEKLQLSGHTNDVLAMDFSQCGTRLATASEDGTVIVWDLATGEELIQLTGNGEYVFSVRFSQFDDLLIACGGNPFSGINGPYSEVGGFIKVWPTKTITKFTKLYGHQTTIGSMRLSPCGRYVATSAADSYVKVWDAESGAELFSYLCNAPISKIEFDEPSSNLFFQDGKNNFSIDLNEFQVVRVPNWPEVLNAEHTNPKLLIKHGAVVQVVNDKSIFEDAVVDANRLSQNIHWHMALAEHFARRQNWFASTRHYIYSYLAKPSGSKILSRLKAAKSRLLESCPTINDQNLYVAFGLNPDELDLIQKAESE